MNNHIMVKINTYEDLDRLANTATSINYYKIKDAMREKMNYCVKNNKKVDRTVYALFTYDGKFIEVIDRIPTNYNYPLEEEILNGMFDN